MGKIIFIIDLDSTIIGDCSYQLQYYNISKKTLSYKTIYKELIPYYKETSKLVRPYFVYFINKMREIYKNNVAFYVYTASSKDWANLQIKLIEKANNIKLNKPVFSRDECKELKNMQGYSKSINFLLTKIKIKKKNPEIIIIDDSDVYIDYKHTQIQCKPYNYILFNEIDCPYDYKKCDTKNKMKLYKWLYKQCREINKSNKKFKNDSFWLNLANAIETNNITDYNSNVIKQLTTISNSS